MEMFININLNSVEEAAKSLKRLGMKLNSQTFSLEGMNCITESSGSTFSAVNDAYRQLKYIESSLKMLVEKTERAIEETGLKVEVTDEDLGKMYNGMLDPKGIQERMKHIK